jgi:hypothetical protein
VIVSTMLDSSLRAAESGEAISGHQAEIASSAYGLLAMTPQGKLTLSSC